MKKLSCILLLAAFSSFSFVSCNQDDILNINDRLDQLETRVVALEKLNSEIAELKTLVTALQENIAVKNVTPVTDGYEIVLSNGDKITIKNGQNGAPGKDGTSPVIGVAAVDDIYYWTVNGEFLLDGNNEKIRVSAAAAPKLKIENDKWYISYDEGATWEFLADAGISGGDCIFSSVTVGDTEVTFVLAGGSSFSLPIECGFSLSLEQDVTCKVGTEVRVAYEVKGAESADVYCTVEGKFTAVIDAKTSTTGDVVITAEEGALEGMVIVYAESANASTFKRIKLAVEKPGIEFVSFPTSDIVFDHTKGIDSLAVALSWNGAEGASYLLEISNTENFAASFKQELGSATSINCTNREAGLIAHGFDGDFKSTVLYFRVSDKNGVISPSEVKSVKFTTEFGCFVDSRDGEIYPIAKVGDKYWMAENMRAVKFTDGTDIPVVGGYASVQYNEGFLGRRAGVFYTYPSISNGNYDGHWFAEAPGTDTQLQGICPEGWHVANNVDFSDAVQEAAAALGTTYSEDFFSKTSYPQLASAFRFAGDFPKLASGCSYNNELGLYFVPAHYYSRDSDRTIKPGDYGYGILIWSISMTNGVWDAYTFQCNQWNDMIFATSNAAHPAGDYAAQMPARCVKNY